MDHCFVPKYFSLLVNPMAARGPQQFREAAFIFCEVFFFFFFPIDLVLTVCHSFWTQPGSFSLKSIYKGTQLGSTSAAPDVQVAVEAPALQPLSANLISLPVHFLKRMLLWHMVWC